MTILRNVDADLPTIEADREKLTQIEERIAQLQAMAHALRDLVACCEHSPAAQPCPILHTLAQPTRADSYSKSTGAG